MTKARNLDLYGDDTQNFRIRKFDLQDDDDVYDLEEIMKNCRVDQKDGWRIISNQDFNDKHGNLFCLLKWTEPGLDLG